MTVEVRRVRYPGAGVNDSCESPDVGAGSPVQVLWKSRKCF